MSCPPWERDAEEHQAPTAEKAMLSALHQARSEVLAGIPTRGHLARWHQRAFRDVVPVPYYAGGFRQVDPSRPCLAVDVGVGEVPAAPHARVLELLEALCTDLRQKLAALELRWTGLPAPERVKMIAVTIGTFVGAFIRVHPFVNGNGRTSRLLWSVLLHRLGYPFRLSLLERPPVIEYASAMAAAMKGDYSLTIALVFSALGQPSNPTASLPLPSRGGST